MVASTVAMKDEMKVAKRDEWKAVVTVVKTAAL